MDLECLGGKLLSSSIGCGAYISLPGYCDELDERENSSDGEVCPKFMQDLIT